jgi:hypothetical protein
MIDASGNGFNLTNIAAGLIADRFGSTNSALQQIASNGVVAQSTQNISISGNANRTVTYWFKLAITNINSSVGIGWGTPDSSGNTYQVTVSGNGVVNQWGNFADLNSTGITDFDFNIWHQVSVVYSGSLSGEVVFVDGVPRAITLGNQNTRTNLNTLATNIKLGGWGFYYTQPGACIDDIRIYNRALSSNEVAELFVFESNPTSPPIITNQPSDFYATGNQPASFNVSVTGNRPLAYQWQFNGTNLLNATNSTLSFTAVKQSNLGQYDVIVTNAYGSVTSSIANLFMYPYLNNPFNGVVTYWGQTNTLSVGAWGSGTLSYQWYFNGVAIDGATDSTLPLGAIQFSNAGQYSVVVNSSLGSVTNAPYQVVVNPANVSLVINPTTVIQGTVGYNYTIQSTINLGDTNAWITETNLTLTQPIQNWTDYSVDTSKSGNSHKFYRVIAGQ